MLQSYTKKSINLIRLYRLLVVWMIIGFGLLILIFTPTPRYLLDFLFSGHIPGTTFVVPYWIMFTMYIGALLALILIKIEDAFYTHEAVKKHMAKRRKTRRRYSHS